MNGLIQAAALADLLDGDAPFALFDVREPVEAERGHVPGSTVLPRRRIEERIGQLVADRATTVVLVDDASGRAELAQQTLMALGHADVRRLDGGIDAWRRAGRRLATGTNVPSKHFGEQVHHAMHVPSIDVATFLRWRDEGRDVLVCDVRTPDEYARATIPGSSSTPSFDLVLGLDALRRHAHVVVHCAGRTRSIVGTQTLHDLGVTHAVALENGTMGWALAGQALEYRAGRELALDAVTDRSELVARSRALADGAGVRRLTVDAFAALLDAVDRDRYAFDVRGTSAYEAGHIAGTRSLPGGQAIQRTDDFVAVRAAPIVLVDDDGARADLTGVWLRRMGYPDVAVLDGGIRTWTDAGRALVEGREPRPATALDAARRTARTIGVDAAATLLADRTARVCVVDVDTSLRFNAGHLPGAVWLPRGWLELRIAAVAPSLETSLLLTCVDGRQSLFAAASLRAMGYTQAVAMTGGTRAWTRSGRVLETAALPPQDDVSLPPYARGERAMRDYLAWETALVDASSASASLPIDPITLSPTP